MLTGTGKIKEIQYEKTMKGGMGFSEIMISSI